jgi:glycosyltransferase involved in cell wall biosynthesis
VFDGDGSSPEGWSGIPYGLGLGLRARGCSVEHVNTGPAVLQSRIARRALRTANLRFAPELAWLRGRSAARRLRDPRAVFIQIGSGYLMPAGASYVTLDDITVKQTVDLAPELARLRGGSALGRRVFAAWNERQRLIYQRAIACCVATEWNRESVIRDYGVPEERVVVVGFGRNLPLQPPATRVWKPPRFLFVGVDWARKNGAAVVAAFEELRARHAPDATLVVVGHHPPISAAGVQEVGRLDLSDPGDRDRLRSLFHSATCFVMPSRFEPFGIVYLEAASAGLPAIGTTVGGARMAIGDGGVVVDPDDHHGLLEAMRRFADPELARRVGERARRHSEPFTWERVAERILAAI